MPFAHSGALGYEDQIEFLDILATMLLRILTN